jgi:exosortase
MSSIAPPSAGLQMKRNPEERPLVAFLFRYPLLALGLAVFIAPVVVGLARNVWTTEQGSHGPLILATGIWLFLHELLGLRDAFRPGSLPLAVAGVLLGIVAYLLGDLAGVEALHGLGAGIALVAVLYCYAGKAVLRRLWFPILYLFMVVPPPKTLIDMLTGSLKLGLASVTADLLALLGYNVASSGSSIYIDQYELTVAAACAGLNSMVTLLAIGLFYIYLLHRADWRYALVLALCVIPIAVIANFARVVFLVLSTHYFGDRMTQNVFHDIAGIATFVLTLGLLFLLDNLLQRFRPSLRKAAA